MASSPLLKSAASWLPSPMLRSLRRLRDAQVRTQIAGILSRQTPPDTTRAERDFPRLQTEFNGVPEYAYDAHTLWRRGSERALTVAELPRDPNKRGRILEVGCGDAMAGYMLSIHGHEVVVSDMDDWRDPRAKSLEFCRCILEEGLPYDDASFDLIFSYNSFEHFADPGKCFAELTRLTKPEGIVYLSYGPLYASPWGLHAWSSLNMPFPQFLFSEAFIQERLKQTGVNDLGKQTDSLQPLNKWRLQQFCDLWTNEKWRIVNFSTWRPDESLPLITRYPECFSGRGLTFDDIVTQAIHVTLQRRQPTR